MYAIAAGGDASLLVQIYIAAGVAAGFLGWLVGDSRGRGGAGLALGLLLGPLGVGAAFFLAPSERPTRAPEAPRLQPPRPARATGGGDPGFDTIQARHPTRGGEITVGVNELARLIEQEAHALVSGDAVASEQLGSSLGERVLARLLDAGPTPPPEP
jgi:hypothetical protein